MIRQHFNTLSILVLFALASSACAHRPPVRAESEYAALQQRESQFLAALSAKDLEQTVAHFADDAVLHVANMPPVEGRSAIADFYRNVFRFMRASDATSERLHISTSADLAYSLGRVSNQFDGAQTTVEYGGKYLLVWEKQAGEWEIVLYSISNNQAAGDG